MIGITKGTSLDSGSSATLFAKSCTLAKDATSVTTTKAMSLLQTTGLRWIA